MATYAGPATLVLDNGSQFDVKVALHSSELPGNWRWWGAVGVAQAPDRWDEPATLRMPDGQEGVVVPAPSVALGGRVLQLTGTGPAPF